GWGEGAVVSTVLCTRELTRQGSSRWRWAGVAEPTAPTIASWPSTDLLSHGESHCEAPHFARCCRTCRDCGTADRLRRRWRRVATGGRQDRGGGHRERDICFAECFCFGSRRSTED